MNNHSAPFHFVSSDPELANATRKIWSQSPGATPGGLPGRRNAEVFQIEDLMNHWMGENRGTLVDFVVVRTSAIHSFQQAEKLDLESKDLATRAADPTPSPEKAIGLCVEK